MEIEELKSALKKAGFEISDDEARKHLMTGKILGFSPEHQIEMAIAWHQKNGTEANPKNERLSVQDIYPGHTEQELTDAVHRKSHHKLTDEEIQVTLHTARVSHTDWETLIKLTAMSMKLLDHMTALVRDMEETAKKPVEVTESDELPGVWQEYFKGD